MLRQFSLGLWAIALLAGLAWLLWRNQELKSIRQASASMREQVAARSGLAESDSNQPCAGTGKRVELPDNSTGKIAGASPAASSTNGDLSPRTGSLTAEEHIELLRLRGQVGLLRREVAEAVGRQAPKTRSTKMNATNDALPAGFPSSANLPTEHYGPGLPMATLEISNLIHRQLEQNGGKVPAALPPELTAQLGAEAAELLGRLELLPGETITPETDCCIFTAREREARRTADGSWVRLYFMANGSYTMAGPLTNPDWERWERQRLGMLRESLRRRMQPH